MVGPPPASWAVEPADASAYEVGEGIWRLRLPLPWDDIPHVNAFAFGHPDGGTILVDCGSGGDPSLWDALVAALAEAGIAVADVRQCVLTHYHSDHAGVLERLVAESGCEVAGHPSVEHFTDGFLKPEEVYAARLERARAEGVPEWLQDACADVREELDGILGPTVPTRPVGEGDRIASVLGDWVVIETPGHAPSHVCLHQPERGILLLGDLLAPAFYPYFDYGYTPDPVAEHFLSFERIDGLTGIELALPGHGRPLADVHETNALWRAEMRRRLDAVEAELAAGATNAWEVVERLYDVEAHGLMTSLDVGEVAAYLRHLRRCGRIVRRVEPDGRFRYAVA